MKKNILILLSVFIFFACQKTSVERMNKITVSILPQKYFVKKITGSKFKINVMIPPGASPATYEPTPQQMKKLSQSILYFRIGYIPFEKSWMNKISAVNKKIKIIDTSDGVNLIKKGKGVDPHIWLSPKAVRIQVKNIYSVLTEVDPDNKNIYKKNYKNFLAEINLLDKKIKNILKNFKNIKFMVYHPAWTYFARDYDLKQIPIEIEGKSPSPAYLKKIIDIAKKENIKVIFVQSQFDTNSAEAIASEIKGKVVPLNPLAENWLDNMIKIANTFKGVLD